MKEEQSDEPFRHGKPSASPSLHAHSGGEENALCRIHTPKLVMHTIDDASNPFRLSGVSGECTIVMCSLERTYDSDPTPAIVSPIPTAAKWEPLVPLGVGVFRSRVECSADIRSRLKSSGVDWSLSH